MKKLILNIIATLDRLLRRAGRFGIVLIFLLIIGLRYFTTQQDKIETFVSGLPIISSFYHGPKVEERNGDPAEKQSLNSLQMKATNKTSKVADALELFLFSSLFAAVALRSTCPFCIRR